MTNRPVIRNYIYFIQADTVPPMVKIGLSKNVTERLSALQKASPVPLRLIASCRGNRALEFQIHGHFMAHHSHSEWFFASDEMLAMARLIEKNKRVRRSRLTGDSRGVPRKSSLPRSQSFTGALPLPLMIAVPPPEAP